MNDIKEIRNKLCKIEDCLTMIFIYKGTLDGAKNCIMKARKDIDDCVYKLEKYMRKSNNN